MIRVCFCICAAWAAAGFAFGQAAAPASPPNSAELKAIVQKVRQLQSQGHLYEALQEVDKAEKLSPGDALVANMRGSIYNDMGDLTKAQESFEEALKRMPGAFPARFNLTELLLAQQKYAEAEAGFIALLKDFPKLQEEVRHFAQFNVLVCRLKQDNAAGAEEMAKNFTFMDDTPAYYFAKAAAAFQKKDANEARSWIARAQKAFKPSQNAAYMDTLTEAHWISNLNAPEMKGDAPKQYPPK